MRAVITVIGQDNVGILAKVSNVCAEAGANIIEVTQSVLQEMFAMIMFVEIENLKISYSDLADNLVALGDNLGLKVHVMHEDIFNTMHHI